MKIVLIDNRLPEDMERALYRLGLTPIRLPKDPCLGEAVASHPDTLLFHHKNDIITTADYCDMAAYIFSDIRELYDNIKITFTSDIRGMKYPNDCMMNALVIGNKIFCNEANISHAIKDYAGYTGLKTVHTNQGYPACTTLAFGNNAITSDRGMARTLSNEGINVLTISHGHISLPPHEYGFIGGASIVVGQKVCFFGNINRHPDGDEILKFICENGYEAISLSDSDLVDFGGGIVL
jgi:hypothetical protein